MSYIDFLRDVGKYINVNYMLNKDIINRRLVWKSLEKNVIIVSIIM